MTNFSSDILDTVESLLDTCPNIPEELEVMCDEHVTVDENSVKMKVFIGDEVYEVTVTKL